MRVFNHSKRKPISIDRLVEICKTMASMDRKESFKFGRENGITKHNVDSIRQMLGYSDFGNAPRFSAEQRERIVEEYREGDVSMCELARRHGVAYNSIRCILVNRNVTIDNPRKWTKRQEMYLLNEYRKGKRLRLIAEEIGKSLKSIQQKISRMKRDGIIKEVNK